jgi:hypothetical protein
MCTCLFCTYIRCLDRRYAPGTKQKRQDDEQEDNAPARPNGDDELPRDNLREGSPTAGIGPDRNGRGTVPRAKRTCWGFPKAHAMLHVRETLRLYGSVAEVSAEPTERRHVSLKVAFAKVEHGPRAALQVLAAEIKREVAMREHFNVSGEGGGARHSIPKPDTVNASFGQRLHASGRRYPVWESIVEWSKCSSNLTLPAYWNYVRSPAHTGQGSRRLILSLTELFDTDSLWCRQASEMQYLPEHMAKFLRDAKPEIVPASIPAAEEDKLTWQQVHALCALVQAYPGKSCRDKDSPHLFVHQGLSIERPGVPGQVLIVHAHLEVGYLYTVTQQCQILHKIMTCQRFVQGNILFFQWNMHWHVVYANVMYVLTHCPSQMLLRAQPLKKHAVPRQDPDRLYSLAHPVLHHTRNRPRSNAGRPCCPGWLRPSRVAVSVCCGSQQHHPPRNAGFGFHRGTVEVLSSNNRPARRGVRMHTFVPDLADANLLCDTMQQDPGPCRHLPKPCPSTHCTRRTPWLQTLESVRAGRYRTR